MGSLPQEAISPPPLNLSHATASDAPELAEVHMAAFEYPPLRQVMYKGLSRKELVKKQEESFAKTIAAQADTSTRETHLLKVTDPVSNEIMALVIWIYLPDGYKVEEDAQASVADQPQGGNERLMRDFAVLVGRLRGEEPGRREGHWLLSLLGTHPKHEKRGAASMLARWAFPRADAEGKRCYVDASAYGHRMYQRCGFEDVGEMSVDLEAYEPGCGFEVQRWKAMVREPAVPKSG